MNRVVEFCRENRPQAILVGARNLNCKALKEDMSRIGDFILDAHSKVANEHAIIHLLSDQCSLYLSAIVDLMDSRQLSQGKRCLKKAMPAMHLKRLLANFKRFCSPDPSSFLAIPLTRRFWNWLSGMFLFWALTIFLSADFNVRPRHRHY